MLTSKQFSARILSLAKHEDALKDAMAELLGFALFHAVAHGNKGPLNELKTLAPYGWLRDMIAKVAAGKRDKNISEQSAQMRADMIVASMFDSRENSRKIAKEQREARAEAKPKAEKIVNAKPGAAVAVELPAWYSALSELNVTDEEVAEIVAAVKAARMEDMGKLMKLAA